MNKFDVLIIGAGPAGIACALMLCQSDIKVAVIEKAAFPRDKICGDALSLDIVNQLAMISPDLLKAFELLENKLYSAGIKIISPGGQFMDLPLYKNGEKKNGYICERFVFDNFLYEQLLRFPQIKFFPQTTVVDVIIDDQQVEVKTDKGSFFSEMILGADGAQSVVNKKTNSFPVDKEHYSAGLRQYFEGVTGFHEENFIELHFFPELLPGYLWIFPLPNGKANVGLGMLSSEVSRKKVNIKEVFHRLIHEHPSLKKRFEKATPLEPIKGYGLPLGSKKRILSGHRFLLAGDAASLIDPFSGEGIANALRSGRVSADIIKKAVAENNFSAKFLQQYDKELYSRIWMELKVSKQLQNLCRRAWFFNFIVRKTERSPYLKAFMMGALENVHKKKIVTGPTFLYHLLFK